jgi:hypothetical protein
MTMRMNRYVFYCVLGTIGGMVLAAIVILSH